MPTLWDKVNMTKSMQNKKNIGKSGTIFPTQSQDYMKFLNNEIQRLRQSGQAVDYSVKDLYNNLVGKLSDATDEAIEKVLAVSGYKDLRLQYSSLKSAEKEILGAANKFLRQQGGQGGGITHPIINIWSLEEFLQGGADALMGNVAGATRNTMRALLIKSAGKLSDYFKSPDKRIPMMFKLLQKYSPK